MKINQPPFAWGKENKSVTLECTQDDEEYMYMYWYRKEAGRGMKMLTYSLGRNISANEPSVSKLKYTMLRPEVLLSTLQIHQVEVGDSAVYYCASSTMVQTCSVA